jgi:hypothetical protein
MLIYAFSLALRGVNIDRQQRDEPTDTHRRLEGRRRCTVTVAKLLWWLGNKKWVEVISPVGQQISYGPARGQVVWVFRVTSYTLWFHSIWTFKKKDEIKYRYWPLVVCMGVKPIPVAAQSKALVCGRTLAGTAGSNRAGGIDVCLLWVLCVVR